jgi:hypothetical protein
LPFFEPFPLPFELVVTRVFPREGALLMQNASKKMGVSTRQHAVARALSMGLIAP